MRKYLIIVFFITVCLSLYAETKSPLFPVPLNPFSYKGYTSHHTSSSLTIDGKLDEKDWQQAQWTDPYIDIVGNSMPKPRFETKTKILWDDEYLYIGAEMEEPDLWATLTQRDAVIYHDNDFEVFIDPDGDTHNYYELEINALNTVWDLFLLKPYRDGDKVALNSWDIQGLKTAVHLNGTLNDPSDKDSGWTVEMALPWKVLGEFAPRVPPQEGDTWRMNFSRVEWKHEVVDGKYVKLKDKKGNNLPEDNWVWSPQGLVAMHYPEMWGAVKFTKFPYNIESVDVGGFNAQQMYDILRQIYYLEKECYLQNHYYDSNIVKGRTFEYMEPHSPIPKQIEPIIETTSTSFVAHVSIWHINQEGKTWVEEEKK